MNTDEWRLEQIRRIVENFLTTGEDLKNPSMWAMQALAQVIAVLDISNAEARERMLREATETHNQEF